MANKNFSLIDIQNDDQEIDLEFQDFGNTSTKSALPGKESVAEQTVYFSNFPDSHEDDQERVDPYTKIQKRKHEVIISTVVKKRKDNNLISDDFIIKPILADEFCNSPQLIKLVILQINSKKFISAAVRALSDCFPVPELLHLKRVKKVDIEGKDPIFYIYLDTLHNLNVYFTVPNELMIKSQFYQLPLEATNSIFSLLDSKKIDCKMFKKNVYISNASKYAPKLRTVFDEVNKNWPCSFHEDLYFKKLLSGNFFCDIELNNIAQFMNLALFLSENSNLETGLNHATLIAKDSNYETSLKFCGTDKRFINPLLHSCMVAIDVVAVNQGGGALPKEMIIEEIEKVNNLCNLNCYVPKLNNDCLSTLNHSNDYICTDYSAYMTDEPCLMCATALLHSRIKRIFYLRPNLERGAAGSVCKLHTLPRINHRYEVFALSLKTVNV